MKLSIKEVVIFSLLGALMYVSKILMEFLPNIHLLGMFTIAFTVVYRAKALYPIYIYVLLNGIFAGFNVWWVPYLYIWTVLWAVTMLLPRRIPKKVAVPVYMGVCGVHGFLFGILYAPAEAMFFGLNFQETMAWIAAGIPFDVIHGIGNLCAGVLVVPLVKVMRLANQ